MVILGGHRRMVKLWKSVEMIVCIMFIRPMKLLVEVIEVSICNKGIVLNLSIFTQ